MTLGKSFTIWIPPLCLSQCCSFNRNSFRGQFFTGRATAALMFAIITGEAPGLQQTLSHWDDGEEVEEKQAKEVALACLSISSSASCHHHHSCFTHTHTHPSLPNSHLLPSRKTHMHFTSIILGLESKVFSYLKFTLHLPLGRACK